MSLYELLLFVHIAGVVVWIGTGIALILLSARFERTRAHDGLGALFDQSGWLANAVFTPVSLLVLLAGIGLVFEGEWSFGDLWVVLGLVGFVLTFLTGVSVIRPRSIAIAKMRASEGMSERTVRRMRDLFVLARIDYAVLLVVIADMVLKPASDDVAVLVAMAAVIGAVAVLSIRAVR